MQLVTQTAQIHQEDLPGEKIKDKDSRKLLFTPRHDFFSLDAGALRENCFCPILGVAYSEIRPLCANLALVSGKTPASFQNSSRSTCVPVPNLSFIVNLGTRAFLICRSAFQTANS